VGGSCEKQVVWLDDSEDRIVRSIVDFGHSRRVVGGAELFPLGDHRLCLGGGNRVDSLDRGDLPSSVCEEASRRRRDVPWPPNGPGATRSGDRVRHSVAGVSPDVRVDAGAGIVVVANRSHGGGNRDGDGGTVDFEKETVSRMGRICNGADHVFPGRNRLSDIIVTGVFNLTKRFAIKQNMGFKS